MANDNQKQRIIFYKNDFNDTRWLEVCITLDVPFSTERVVVYYNNVDFSDV